MSLEHPLSSVTLFSRIIFRRFHDDTTQLSRSIIRSKSEVNVVEAKSSTPKARQYEVPNPAPTVRC